MKRFFQHDHEFLENIKFFHDHYSDSTQREIQSIAETNIDEIFRQAVYCFLTPATKSDSADYTYTELFTNNFFYNASQEELALCLRKPPYIRFHNQKATRLIFWRENGLSIIKSMIRLRSPEEKRAYLINNTKGFSFKESTHFLRNIGMSGDLVIVDRHIVYFMKKVQILASDSSDLPSPSLYLKWELLFQNFINNKLWIDTMGRSSIPQADFAVWAACVQKADPKISKERILLLR